MDYQFKKIGIIGKFGAPTVGETLLSLTKCLLDKKLEVFIDKDTAQRHPNNNFPVVSREEMGTQCDLAIVVGGDGSFLNAARSLAQYDIPMLGVNLGRLGFLTDIAPNKIDTYMEEVLNGEFTEERRCLLNSSILRDGEHIMEGPALNDVVVHKLDVARMIEFEVHINGEFVNRQRADGLIVSTPTGSTAYALSGGGPILAPALKAVVIVPICPHTLSSRPIVVPGNTVIEITLMGPSGHAQVSRDGQSNEPLVSGDKIIVQRYDHGLRMIHPSNYSPFRVLRQKLGWSG
ncbi:MAG: NAD(+) kinase [Thiotrichales bacterium]|jgi:NAD+ kinase|nr:NAD(+) kinase [Thiotrichales bacterium]MBT3613206.1 NAD(+) kinase [Thiotrichales bacterium]MBT3751780.1 NAD(+) kinase [Thiotrichales bacterium]MBT3837937.1 NAD(+) kinase [Thiotrichales bacterium]MBT4151520.1 NAD(+) kinase [Thiotrichales bacterium]